MRAKILGYALVGSFQLFLPIYAFGCCRISLPTIAPPHIDPPRINPPKINLPKVPVPAVKIPKTNWSLTPVGPLPNSTVAQAQKTVDTATQSGSKVLNAGAGVAATAINNSVSENTSIVNVIAGTESLSDAGKQEIVGQGQQIAAIGQAVAETDAATHNVSVVAAQTIGGDVGKTAVDFTVGTIQLQADFAATAAIEGGEILQGQSPETVIAAPLAAAIRSAELELEDSAQPIPDDVKSALAPYYPADVLDNARWTVGSFSFSLPDVVNSSRKAFQGLDNAVTVGHVTVFRRDPEHDYHWWAHELWHQVQYHEWNIDQFAYRYVTSCHDVESEAEDKAQQLFPIGSSSIAC